VSRAGTDDHDESQDSAKEGPPLQASAGEGGGDYRQGVRGMHGLLYRHGRSRVGEGDVPALCSRRRVRLYHLPQTPSKLPVLVLSVAASRKLVYADWLEEQGDPRAEYLRLMMKVRQERVTVTPEQRQRHRQLCAELAGLRPQRRRTMRAGSSQVDPQRQARIQELESQLAELAMQMRRKRDSRTTSRTGSYPRPQLAGCSERPRD
jgi:hypothetical protein